MRVSALSGESILGPHWPGQIPRPGRDTFQHSLVSLFWGHKLPGFTVYEVLQVSALSGESILGPPQGARRQKESIDVSALSGESILGPPQYNTG